MAKTAFATPTCSSSVMDLARLSEREAYELEQYEKIVQLRDTIISGSHPTIALNSSKASLEAAREGENVAGRDSLSKFHDNGGLVSVRPNQSTNTGQPEPDPAFSKKSDERLRDELQVQRQQLERALKEEVEQRHIGKLGHTEPSSELDLSDVLAKALVIVQAPVPPGADREKLNANTESTSDSFDESTFYSSRHDTPESHLVSRIRNSPEIVQVTNINSQHNELSQQHNKQPPTVPSVPLATEFTKDAHDPHSVGKSNQNATQTSPTSQISIVPGLNNYIQTQAASMNPTQSTKAGTNPSRVPRQDALQTTAPRVLKNDNQIPRDNYHETYPPSPLVRNHNTLQPVAPQPTHPSSVSALAAASTSILDTSLTAGHLAAVPTSVQVATLRTEQNTVTSPDNSSQGGKKKTKKKKRKADKQGGAGTEGGGASYIKQEPRSPSPLNTSSYIRPSKRPRHEQESSAAHGYEASYDPANVLDAGVQYVERPVRDRAASVGHAAAATYQQPYSSTTTGTGEPRYSSGRCFDQPVVVGGPAQHHDGRLVDSPMHYLAGSGPASGPVSQVMLADSRPVSSRPYRELHESSRMTSHPDGETFALPPRPAPTRILVDAYGREYIEPQNHPSSRLSIVSPSRPGEHEVVYERVPSRALSHHPGSRPYDDGGVVYTASAPAPAYGLPRRIITQPEYATHDYRDTRQREFTTRPVPSQGEFVQVLPPHERRYGDSNYGVRPSDGVRYQMPPHYGRFHGVRPELSGPAEYRASVHPDSHQDSVQPYMREYPAESVMQRAYSVRPADHSHSGQLRGADEVAFIERPNGAPQEIVYTDDARREFYR